VAPTKIQAAGFSHVGMRRSENQDSYLIAPDLNLYVVADGMGGHKGGETASSLAVQTINHFFRNNPRATASIPPSQKLKEAILAANKAIQEKGQQVPELSGMGTTTTALYFAGGKIYLGQVGDSRSYLIHPKRIWQITRDHSLVQEKLRAGLITHDQLKTDRMKNVITRSVGFENDLDVDVYQMETHPGDVFLICSDGLTGMLDDDQILAIIEQNVFGNENLEAATQKLIEMANFNGGDDNVTAIVVQVQ
jgi:protein phosphatase